MARIICGTSGVPFTASHIPMTLSRREMNHPIFYLPQKRLLGLYSVYIKGGLTDIDSYLLFTALLKSTDCVSFSVPTIVSTATERIIANNIKQLVGVIWETNAIMHPGFKQPKFCIRTDNANLDNVKIWIKAWRKNIECFKSGIDTRSYTKKLKAVEDRLSKLIFSPTSTSDISLCNAVANWADIAADFPPLQREDWKKIIRKTYNMEAMFLTDKREMMQLLDYCETNLEAGSIHYYTLMKMLRNGIASHNNFLGLGSLDSDSPSETKDCGYAFIDSPTEDRDDNSKSEDLITQIAARAPSEEPHQRDYPTKLQYLKARLAYRAACSEILKLKIGETL